MLLCLFFSLPSAVGGWSQPHPLRQLVWWKPTHLLGIGHVEGVDSIVEFSLRVDRENNLVEIKQRYHVYANKTIRKFTF